MSYCSKCGAELDKDAKFCPKCGATAGPPEIKPEIKRGIRPISILAIILIAIIVVAVVLSAIAFIPNRIVGPINRKMSVPYKAGVNTLNLNLTATVVGINITFQNLKDELQSPLIILNASATARVGIFGSSDFLDQYMPVWQNQTEGNVLTVTVKQEVDTTNWPPHSSLNVTFDIFIDLSMNTSLNIHTSTGGIILNTQAGAIINHLNLETTTGAVEANLVEDVILAGDISCTTTTGGIKFSWDNLMVEKEVAINSIATTGGIEMSFKQHEMVMGNITLNVDVGTGGVDFLIDIKDDLGAKIESSVTTGGIDVNRQVGFSGTEALLQSTNYPAGYNFDVTLETTTGGIDIDAKYTP